MAEDLYGASIDGIAFQAETIEDNFEKAIAKYEFPYRAGALLEDMGQKARQVKIRAYFFNDTYTDHLTLVQRLIKNEVLELVHPQYGLVKGCVESISIRHDERNLTAEVDITFIENLRGEFAETIYEDVEAVLEENFSQGQQEQQEEFADDMRADLGAEAEDILAQDLLPDLGVLEQLTGLSQTARGYVKEIDAYVSNLEAMLNDITQPANSLLATITYLTNLPGRVISTVARTAERYGMLYESLEEVPEQMINSLDQGLLAMNEAVPEAGGLPVNHYENKPITVMDVHNPAIRPPLTKHTAIAAAQRLALAAGYAYSQDERRRDEVRRAEKRRSFDINGNYMVAQPITPVMTVNELERSLAKARTRLQEAVDQSRTMPGLKAMAVNLLTHVNRIKIEREKVITVDVRPALPLHLVCLKYGLPYNYAERIYSINDLVHPSFTAGEVNIYAR